MLIQPKHRIRVFGKKSLAAMFLLTAPCTLHAQGSWQPANSSPQYNITALYFGDTFYLAGVSNQKNYEIYRSIDKGANWSKTFSATGLTSVIIYDFAVTPKPIPTPSGWTPTFYAATSLGLFQSGNDGRTWSSMKWPTNSAGVVQALRSIRFISSFNDAPMRSSHTLVVAGPTGVWRMDTGKMNSPADLNVMIDNAVFGMIRPDYTFTAGTQNGVFRYSTASDTWKSFNTGLTNLNVIDLIRMDNGVLFAATPGGVFRSDNDGKLWVSISGKKNVQALACYGQVLLLGCTDGVFRSYQGSISTDFSPMNTGLSQQNIISLDINNTNFLFAGTSQGIYKYIPALSSPGVTILDASNLESYSATLNGSVNPKGWPTTYFFEYGSGTQLTNRTPEASAGTGTADVKAEAKVTDLLPDSTYSFEMVAWNGIDTVRSSTKTFRTLLPPPVLISPADDTLNQPLAPYFSWSQVRNAASYLLEVSQNIAFNDFIVRASLVNNHYYGLYLSSRTRYFWRVSSVSTDGQHSNPSPASTFYTKSTIGMVKFDFDDGMAQGWSMEGPFDERGDASAHSNFSFFQSDETNYPNPPGKDLLNDEKMSIGVGTPGGHGIIKPGSDWWVLRLASPDLTNAKDWQNVKGFSVQIAECLAGMNTTIQASLSANVFDNDRSEQYSLSTGTSVILNHDILGDSLAVWNRLSTSWVAMPTFPGNYTLRGIAVSLMGEMKGSFPAGAVYLDEITAMGNPEIAITPNVIKYGYVSVGSFSDQIITIANKGTGDLIISADTLLGIDASQFSIFKGGAPFTLAPGEKHDMKVRFTPDTKGEKSARLSISGNIPAINVVPVELAGTGIIPAVLTIEPITASEQMAGAEFYVEVEVGDTLQQVTNLFAIDFTLNYDQSSFIKYISAEPGSFFGTDVTFSSTSDEVDGKVRISINRSASQPGVDGYGTVARIKLALSKDIPDNSTIRLSMSDVMAVDTLARAMAPHPGEFSMVVRSGIMVWPGDTNNNGYVDQADVLPIGLGWNSNGPARMGAASTWIGQLTMPWHRSSATYADANGDGVINQDDISSISTNWHKGHDRTQRLANAASGLAKGQSVPSLVIVILGNTNPGQNFIIDIIAREVTGLFGLSYELVYSPAKDFEIGSISTGSYNFMGNDLLFLPVISTDAGIDSGRICVGISRKLGQGTVSGTGLVTQINAHTSASAESIISQSMFTLTNIHANDENGNPIQIDSSGYRLISDAEIRSPGKPSAFALYENYPNPFNATTTIEYDLPIPEDVRMDLYDIDGRLIRTLKNERQSSGKYRVIWDGRNSKGVLQPSGVYLLSLRAGSFRVTKRLSLIK